jgi:hypothetical protein
MTSASLFNGKPKATALSVAFVNAVAFGLPLNEDAEVILE